MTGKTEEEGLRTGVDNACALLASGVTDTLRCQRTVPRKAELPAAAGSPASRRDARRP